VPNDGHARHENTFSAQCLKVKLQVSKSGTEGKARARIRSLSLWTYILAFKGLNSMD